MSTSPKDHQSRPKKRTKLNIRSIKHLGFLLGSSPTELLKISKNAHRFFKTREIQTKDKARKLAVPNSRLKAILRRLNRHLQNLTLPPYICGGIRGRSNIENALHHSSKPLIFKADLKDFFPSIDSERVRTIFLVRLGCSKEVADVLTELTTYEGKLPQGSPTSTMLANFAIEHLAFRLSVLAKQHGAEYTQFVDDITISGPKHLIELKSLIVKIIAEAGFISNPKKLVIQTEKEEHVVTGVRINFGKDIPKNKLMEITQKIKEMKQVVLKGDPISTKEIRSLEGKIRYYSRLNPGSAAFLARQFKTVLKIRHENLLTEVHKEPSDDICPPDLT